MTTATATAASEPQHVERVLAQLDALPSLSAVAVKVLALTEDDRSGARQLAEIVAGDPSLAARVLSMAGRACVGARPEAATIQGAVTLLGFNTVRQITLASKVMDAFSTANQDESGGLDRKAFWRHCLATACAARHIARLLENAPPPEEAFLFGLLHDLGKLALHAALPKSYAKVLRRCAGGREEITDAERAILGLDHCIAGRRLAERWRLPQRLVECIWLHHHLPDALPAGCAAGRHVQIVQLADVLVREHRIGDSGNDLVSTDSRELGSRLGVSEEARVSILETLPEELESRAEWIGDDSTISREIYLRALLKASEELTTANARLSEQNRRLERRAQYFAAMDWMHRAIVPEATVRDVCGLGAETLRRCLAAPAVVILADSADGAWHEVGWSDGTIQNRLDARPPADADARLERELATAAQLALAGAWAMPPGPAVGEWAERYRSLLGDGRVWLTPIVSQQRRIAAALFASDDDVAVRVREESAEIGAVSAAIGQAISQAQSQTASRTLADELGEANRRISVMYPELVRAQALETVVDMAAGAAHELNNPLTVISGRAQTLMTQLEDPSLRASAEGIVRSAQAASDIVTELLDFASPPVAAPTAINLRDLMSELVAALVAEGLLDAAQITVTVGPETPSIWFDRTGLERLFRELVRNAIEATDPAIRRLTVKAEGDLTEESVVVRVEDNGRGMTPEVLAKASAPFFSHRPAGRGRGLGLARVHRWVRSGGGTIRIHSEPNVGTCVELKLPAAKGNAAP